MNIIVALQDKDYNNRASIEELERKTGLTNRAVRSAIARLRRKGYWIISCTEFGGYYLGTAQQWDRFCDVQRRRGIANFYAKSTELEGQIKLEGIK